MFRPWFFRSAAAVLLASTPTMATEFQAFGGRGSDAYRAVCQPGSYLVGLRYRSGAWMDQITPLCKRVKADGTYSKSMYGKTFGGNGGGQDERTCPAGSAIRDMQAPTTKDDGKVLSFTFGCVAANKSGIGGPTASLNIGTFSVAAASSTFRGWQTCPDGEMATGLHGGYGKHVNSAGLICDRFVVPRDAAADAKAEEARRKQREYEIQVTGRTAEQCMQASNACQARMRAQLGPVNAVGPIATECLPYQQQCLANAATEAAKASGGTPGPVPPPAGGQTATVVNPTTVYNQPEGKDVCYAAVGDTGKLVQKKDDEERWLLLSGITGGCGGKNGWVWKGDNGEDVTVK